MVACKKPFSEGVLVEARYCGVQSPIEALEDGRYGTMEPEDGDSWLPANMLLMHPKPSTLCKTSLSAQRVKLCGWPAASVHKSYHQAPLQRHVQWETVIRKATYTGPSSDFRRFGKDY